MKKENAVFICELPPPYGGVTIKNNYIIQKIFNTYDIKIIDLMKCKKKKFLIFKTIFEIIKAYVNKDIFKDVFTGTKPTVKRAVPAENIVHLEKVVTRLPEKLEFALSMFLFSYYTRGMSFVDLAHLKNKDIQGGVLTDVRRKTG